MSKIIRTGSAAALLLATMLAALIVSATPSAAYWPPEDVRPDAGCTIKVNLNELGCYFNVK